jgi:hypothetical protein
MCDRRLATRWLFAALAVITSAGLFTAAALASAPPVVLPLLVAVCIGLPMIAAWELRSQVGSLRRARGPLDRTALAQLRRHLDELPETQHPLGL